MTTPSENKTLSTTLKRNVETLSIELLDGTLKNLIIKEINIDMMFKHANMILAFFKTISDEKENQSKVQNIDELRALLVKVGPELTDWDGEDLLKLSLSQITGLYAFFKVVNPNFLSILESLKVKSAFNNVMSLIQIGMENVGNLADGISQQNEKPLEPNEQKKTKEKNAEKGHSKTAK